MNLQKKKTASMDCYDFIVAHIDETTRCYQKEWALHPTLIPLPYPYTVPCANGGFQEMYYWDTYFTNKGLILIEKINQAVNNVKNLIYLLKKYKKIPNGSATHYLERSQPPFLGLMLKDVLKTSKEITVTEAYEALKIEYNFWTSQRNTANGLNRYYCDNAFEQEELEATLKLYEARTGIMLEKTKENARSVYAEAESGWDFSPRFQSECSNYNPVDLNCLLYADEVLLSQWANELGLIDESKTYEQSAENRKALVKELMKHDGIYYDWNFVKKTHSDCISCASLFPYFVGIDNDKNDFKKAIEHLEYNYGLVAAKDNRTIFQWAEPNAWAPLQYIAVEAANLIGCKNIADRLRKKYLMATETLFNETGRLWEKYNAITGGLDVSSEYGTPEMFGWAAGVYVYFKKF